MSDTSKIESRISPGYRDRPRPSNAERFAGCPCDTPNLHSVCGLIIDPNQGMRYIETTEDIVVMDLAADYGGLFVLRPERKLAQMMYRFGRRNIGDFRDRTRGTAARAVELSSVHR